MVLGRFMANSKFEYIRTFELEDRLLQDLFFVVRIDGRSFHKYFCTLFWLDFLKNTTFPNQMISGHLHL